MASPFDFFRKRQAGMMVVMVILSMLLFTLDALFTQQGANFWLLGLLLGGAVFGVAGVGSGKWLSWGIGGAAHRCRARADSARIRRIARSDPHWHRCHRTR